MQDAQAAVQTLAIFALMLLVVLLVPRSDSDATPRFRNNRSIIAPIRPPDATAHATTATPAIESAQAGTPLHGDIGTPVSVSVTLRNGPLSKREPNNHTDAWQGCIPAEFTTLWSPQLITQWKLSRALLGVETLENECDEARKLAAYLAGEPQWIGLETKTYGGVLNASRGLCQATWRGREVRYVRVYKGANDAICSNLRRIDDGSPTTMPPVTFSFVRHPIDHFISGYSEIAHRANLTRSHPLYRSYLYTFTRAGHNESAAAESFLRDFVTGALHRTHDVTDVHVFPQVAFLAGAAASLGFVGQLEGLGASWRAFGAAAGLLEWPAFNASFSFDHPTTDSRSGSTARKAMEDLLASERFPALEVMCRVLLPDFACFRYPLPERCKERIGSNHGVVCPYTFPERH